MPEASQPMVTVIDSRKTQKALPLVNGNGRAFAVLWPENGAEYRTFNVIQMSGGDWTRDLVHQAECIYYVETGAGSIRDVSDDTAQPLVEGSMIHISPGDCYRLEASDAGMRLIGGCVPVDPALYQLTSEDGGAA